MSDHSRVSRSKGKDTDTSSTNDNKKQINNSTSEIDNIMSLQSIVGNQAVIKLLAQRELDKTANQNETDSTLIQRYPLSGGDASNLTEGKYASADLTGSLNFSTFSSCIGIVGQKGGKMVGAHLVRVGPDDKGPDVDSVISALDGIENGMMFGFLENWEGGIKGDIAKGLGIYDWRNKETQNGWKVTWADDDWVLDNA